MNMKLGETQLAMHLVRKCLDALDGRNGAFLLGDTGPLAVCALMLDKEGNYAKRDEVMKK